ncbi:hypothetical protein EL22_25555 [Halostagnicola sp. A56]|nr:hypothetical protein EL22_25555 [Halostagnicola sp. A56]
MLNDSTNIDCIARINFVYEIIFKLYSKDFSVIICPNPWWPLLYVNRLYIHILTLIVVDDEILRTLTPLAFVWFLYSTNR